MMIFFTWAVMVLTGGAGFKTSNDWYPFHNWVNMSPTQRSSHIEFHDTNDLLVVMVIHESIRFKGVSHWTVVRSKPDCDWFIRNMYSWFTKFGGVLSTFLLQNNEDTQLGVSWKREHIIKRNIPNTWQSFDLWKKSPSNILLTQYFGPMLVTVQYFWKK